MTSREEHVYLAKLCEQAERYDEMVQEMDHVAKAVRFPHPRAGGHSVCMAAGKRAAQQPRQARGALLTAGASPRRTGVRVRAVG